MQDRDAEHEQLLALARNALAAAHDHDRLALVATTNQFLRALAVHFDDERVERTAFDDDVRAARALGTDELAEEFMDLMRCASQQTSSADCGCEPVALGALRRLVSQISVESPECVPSLLHDLAQVFPYIDNGGW